MLAELRQMIASPMFLWGVIGALAPEILALYKMRREGLSARSPIYYVLITLLYGAIGGALAFGLGAVTRVAALYIGLSWPANLAIYAGLPLPNPDKKLSFRQMLGVLYYRRP